MTLIVIWLLEWVETIAIAKIIQFSFHNYTWVEIGVKMAEISQKPGWRSNRYTTNFREPYLFRN